MLIGKNGQLGQAIVQQCLINDYQIIAYNHEELDILETNKIRQEIIKIKPNILINTSAFHILPDCEIYPNKAFLVNTIAVKNLAVVCKEFKIKVITYSTDYVFDGKKNSPYNEDDKPNPLQMYGLSKFAGEIACLNYCPDSIIIRTSGVYGNLKGSRSKKGNFVLYVINEAKSKKKLEVSCEQISAPTYADDLATATMKLIDNKSNSGIYHLVNEGYCSWAEFASEISKLIKSDLRIIPINRKGFSNNVNRPIFSVLKNNKASAIGIVLPNWKNALLRYIKFLLENQNTYMS